MIILNKKGYFFRVMINGIVIVKIERLYVYMKIVQCNQLIIYVRNKYEQVKVKNIQIKIIV